MSLEILRGRPPYSELFLTSLSVRRYPKFLSVDALAREFAPLRRFRRAILGDLALDRTKGGHHETIPLFSLDGGNRGPMVFRG